MITMNQNQDEEFEPDRLPLASDICRRCGRHLTNPVSVNHGYGPACYKKRMNGDIRQTKTFEPCTINDKSLAQKVYQAIYRLVSRMDETVHPARWKCQFCGTEIKDMPLESFDCDEGVILPGFGAPQWIYFHDTHYDLAIWKIGITNEKIIAEMQAHGDIPQEQARECPR